VGSDQAAPRQLCIRQVRSFKVDSGPFDVCIFLDATHSRWGHIVSVSPDQPREGQPLQVHLSQIGTSDINPLAGAPPFCTEIDRTFSLIMRCQQPLDICPGEPNPGKRIAVRILAGLDAAARFEQLPPAEWDLWLGAPELSLGFPVGAPGVQVISR
jgi:hypothetical protein